MGYTSNIPQILRTMDTAAERAITAVCSDIVLTAKRNTREVFRTRSQGGSSVGTLRASIDKDIDRRGVDTRGYVGAGGPSVKYAAIQEFGGVIRAKGDGYLRFPVGDGWATVKEVTLPPRPYLRPAVTQHSSEIEARFASEMARHF